MGFRVLKTALAVVIAMYLAHVLDVKSPAAAGLLAILGIEVTKKKGIQSALHRIGASMLALLTGSLLFMVLGFHVWVVGIFILVVFPILHRLRITEGAVTGAVVMLHLFAYESAGWTAVLNEILLLLIGLGTATIINIAYMPKTDKAIEAHKQRIESLFSDIFVNMAKHLRDNTVIWDGKELLEVSEEINHGAGLAKRTMENTLIFGGDPYLQVYFFMRGEQLESIHRMIDLVAQVYQTLPQGEWVAAILEDISQSVKEDYYTGEAEKELQALDARYKQLPLPESREEFEVRSAILQLNRELMQYLSIAKKQKKQRPQAG
ncbi:aromatic acid exporter family protein [Paenibacillus alginolyticus]|uniref:Aromatic acid exporter family protein n=1 Tax=Paenibacillus alginolyticus TaxID=59839 RepID=A0ABT4GFU4_9BACL|nr:aromatic acid exporter family protein [Paenibacillus alginolyticus]MCY9668759.1 aromatic acid exporter family protein [Paenibacillus alginolyticus]MCY9695016.1 aromatic acid exporter family protein [Paenibacillus alginolyticus]MEC0145428.1 aromatic acid exporter family protein [Paenibacillus alginolyticus]